MSADRQTSREQYFASLPGAKQPEVTYSRFVLKTAGQ